MGAGDAFPAGLLPGLSEGRTPVQVGDALADTKSTGIR
jgi:sugar/nucleoside kinase (ribokinase family)